MIQSPVIRYHGGKFRLAPWVISHFPPMFATSSHSEVPLAF